MNTQRATNERAMNSGCNDDVLKKRKQSPVVDSSSKASQKKKRKESAKGGTTSVAPVKPLNAYNFFFREERDRWMAEAAQSKHGAQSKAKLGRKVFCVMGVDIGQRWRELTPEKKVVYQKMALEDAERYKRERLEYIQRETCQAWKEFEDNQNNPKQHQQQGGIFAVDATADEDANPSTPAATNCNNSDKSCVQPLPPALIGLSDSPDSKVTTTAGSISGENDSSSASTDLKERTIATTKETPHQFILADVAAAVRQREQAQQTTPSLASTKNNLSFSSCLPLQQQPSPTYAMMNYPSHFGAHPSMADPFGADGMAASTLLLQQQEQQKGSQFAAGFYAYFQLQQQQQLQEQQRQQQFYPKITVPHPFSFFQL